MIRMRLRQSLSSGRRLVRSRGPRGVLKRCRQVFSGRANSQNALLGRDRKLFRMGKGSLLSSKPGIGVQP